MMRERRPLRSQNRFSDIETEMRAVPPPRWIFESGPDSDIVLSTRYRIARNLAYEWFPWHASEGQRKYAAERIVESARRGGGELGCAWALCADDLSVERSRQLLEWRYASRDWIGGGPHRWLLIAPDAVTSM